MQYQSLKNELLELIDQEKFEAALNIIDKQLNQDKFSKFQVPIETYIAIWKEKWQFLFLKCKIYEMRGKFTQALTLIDEILEESKELQNLTSEVQLTGLVAKTIPLFFLGRIDENSQIIKGATQLLGRIKQISQVDKKRYNALISLSRGLNLLYTSNYKQGLANLQNGLDTLQQLNTDNWLVGLGLLFKGMYYSEMGEYKQALDLLKLSAEFNQQRGFSHNYNLNLGHIANSYCEKGDLINAEKYGLRANTLAKERDNVFVLGYTQRTLGRIFLTMGDFIKAEEMFRAAWKNWESSETLHVYFPISWLGLVHRMRGEQDLAIKYFLFGLEKIQEIGYKNAEGWALDFLGELHWEKGDFQEALTYLNEALKVREELGNKIDITRSLFNLFLVNLELKNSEKAKEQLQTLKHLNIEIHNPIIKIRTQLAEALILMQSRKLIEKGHAQNILLELISLTNVEGRIKILALLNLFDILIIEWKASEEEETLEEIYELLKELETMARNQNISTLLIEHKILLANVLLIEGNIEKIFSVLNEASDMAKIRNLSHLEEKINQMREKVTDQIKEWQILLENNASIAQRLEKSEILDYLNIAKRLTSFY